MVDFYIVLDYRDRMERDKIEREREQVMRERAEKERLEKDRMERERKEREEWKRQEHEREQKKERERILKESADTLAAVDDHFARSLRNKEVRLMSSSVTDQVCNGNSKGGSGKDKRGNSQRRLIKCMCLMLPS